MKKLLVCLSLLGTILYAEEQEDPLLWNVEHINRTHKVYEQGGATLDDLRAAVQQAHTILEEQEAEKSYYEYVHKYYPNTLHVTCFVAGAAVMYLWRS